MCKSVDVVVVYQTWCARKYTYVWFLLLPFDVIGKNPWQSAGAIFLRSPTFHALLLMTPRGWRWWRWFVAFENAQKRTSQHFANLPNRKGSFGVICICPPIKSFSWRAGQSKKKRGYLPQTPKNCRDQGKFQANFNHETEALWSKVYFKTKIWRRRMWQES